MTGKGEWISYRAQKASNFFNMSFSWLPLVPPENRAELLVPLVRHPVSLGVEEELE